MSAVDIPVAEDPLDGAGSPPSVSSSSYSSSIEKKAATEGEAATQPPEKGETSEAPTSQSSKKQKSKKKDEDNKKGSGPVPVVVVPTRPRVSIEQPPSAATRCDIVFPSVLQAALPATVSSTEPGSGQIPPRFRLLHPHGFRMLKKSSVVERSMRNYFRLPEAPSDVIRMERKRIQKQLIQIEKDELVEERRVAGKNRSGIALDGFLLLNAGNTETPEEVEVVTLQSSKLTRSVPEDLSYFQNLFFLDVSENKLMLEDLLMLGGLETLHMAYNKIQSLRGIEEVLQWQLDHKKSIIVEFRPEVQRKDSDEYEEDAPFDVLLPHLSALNLSYNRIPATELSLLSFFPSLQQLDLSGNNLKALTLDMAALVSVTHLALEGNNFSSNSQYGSDVFTALSTMPSLLEVNLNHNKLSVVPPLAPVPGHCFFPALEVVGLTHNRFATPESVVELAHLHRTLRRVVLSDTPLSKDPNGAVNTRMAFDQIVANVFVDLHPGSGVFEETQTRSGLTGATEGDEKGDTWKDESWFRFIPQGEEGASGAKLDVKSAAAAAAAAAAAERKNQEAREAAGVASPPKEEKVESSCKGEADVGAANGDKNADDFFLDNEEYIRCDDIEFDAAVKCDGEEGVAPNDDEEMEHEAEAESAASLDPVHQFSTPEEYVAAFYVELLFQDSTYPKKTTRDFLSMTRGKERSPLVTIPEYQEFMDIYRLAGGKRAQFKREEQRKKQKGIQSPTPLIITKDSEEEHQMDPLSPLRKSRNVSSPTKRRKDDSLPSSPSPLSCSSPLAKEHTNADNVFLTAVNDDGPFSNAESTEPNLSEASTPSPTKKPGARPLLPSVCPVTTNVHAAMTELRTLLRNPLPSLPYSTAHLTAPLKTKVPRHRK